MNHTMRIEWIWFKVCTFVSAPLALDIESKALPASLASLRLRAQDPTAKFEDCASGAVQQVA